jgi:hypothetical protein
LHNFATLVPTQDAVELVVDSELVEGGVQGDSLVNTELLATERIAKREIRLE